MFGLSAVCSVPQTAAGASVDEYNVENGVKTPLQTVKETGCISLYWGVIVFFSSLSFWGGGGTWWHGPSTC